MTNKWGRKERNEEGRKKYDGKGRNYEGRKEKIRKGMRKNKLEKEREEIRKEKNRREKERMFRTELLSAPVGRCLSCRFLTFELSHWPPLYFSAIKPIRKSINNCAFFPFKSFFSSVYPLQSERGETDIRTAVAAAGTSALTCLWKHTQFSAQASWSVVSRAIIQLCPILQRSSGLRLTLTPIITTFGHDSTLMAAAFQHIHDQTLSLPFPI